MARKATRTVTARSADPVVRAVGVPTFWGDPAVGRR